MIVESSNWLKQAEADLHSSENSLNSKDYYLSAFMSQQAVEKGLKSLYIKRKKSLLKTHSISVLAKEIKLPENLLNKISDLENVYQETRYPDVSKKIPVEEYGENDATDLLDVAMEGNDMGKRTDEIKKMILKFIYEISKVVNIEKVILFGSWARGDANKNSDIDITILSNDFEKIKYFKRSGKFYLKWNHLINIDIICLTPEEFEIKRKQIGTIGEAANEG